MLLTRCREPSAGVNRWRVRTGQSRFAVMLAGAIVRTGLGLATLAFAVVGTLVGGDVRWYAASGLTGTMWWMWDFLSERVFQPMGQAVTRMFFEGADLPAAPATNPEATIQRLEARLEQSVSRKSDIQTALRLADLYRAVRDDDVRAVAIVQMMKARYPDSAELKRFLEFRSNPSQDPPPDH